MKYIKRYPNGTPAWEVRSGLADFVAACPVPPISRGVRGTVAEVEVSTDVSAVASRLGWEVEMTKTRRRKPTHTFPDLTGEVMDTVFGRLYDRESHVRQVYRAMRTAWDSRFAQRPHVLLLGDPGCGKSSLLRLMAGWLGPELFWHVDGSSVSKAGLETELLKRASGGSMAPFVGFEEMEKVGSEKVLSCLLQVMDDRATIQRVNARDGDQSAECHSLFVATVNDVTKFGKMMKGALRSRFAATVAFHRPGIKLMYKILATRVIESDGDPAWASRVVDFMFGELARCPAFRDTYNDPRLGLYLLTGGASLLDDGESGFLHDFRVTNGLTAVVAVA